MLTTDNVMTKVHQHNDAILFPRLRNRFGETSLADDKEDAAPSPARRSSSVDGDNAGGDEQKTNVQERLHEELSGQDEQNEQEQGPVETGMASTLPAPSTQSRPNTTGAGGERLSKTASSSRSHRHKHSLRPKSPVGTMGIKALSKSKINETLDMMKVS
jgi:hypothetical protein